jgi:Ca-activated chloride channel homolog
MKFNHIQRVLFLLLILSCNISCLKDTEFNIIPRYSNPADIVTGNIFVNIPRITHRINADSNYELEIYVSASNQQNEVIRNLNKQNFKVKYTCDKGSEICSYKFLIGQAQERIPLAVAITMDYSGSMSDEDVLNMEEGVRQFVQLLEPADYVQIVKFSSTVEIINEFSNDRYVILNAINQQFDDRTATAFWESIYIGLQSVDAFTRQYASLIFPCLIGFTDGYENISNASIYDIISTAVTNQTPVYAIGIGTIDETSMRLISDRTGGGFYYTESSTNIDFLFNSVTTNIEGLYTLVLDLENAACTAIEVSVSVEYESASGHHKATSKKNYTLD